MAEFSGDCQSMWDCYVEALKLIKRQPTDRGNTFAHTSGEGLISKIHKERDKTQHQKTPQLKNGQRTWIDTSPKRTHRWPADTWKDAQSLVIRGMQIRTTMRYHLTCQNDHHQQIHKQQVLARTGRKGTLVPWCWECRLGQPPWETVWSFLKTIKMELPFDPVMPLLGIDMKDLGTWTTVWWLGMVGGVWEDWMVMEKIQ